MHSGRNLYFMCILGTAGKLGKNIKIYRSKQDLGSPGSHANLHDSRWIDIIGAVGFFRFIFND